MTMQALSRLEQLKEEPPAASAPPMDDILSQLEKLPTPSKVNPNLDGKGSSKGTSHTFPRGTFTIHCVWLLINQ